MINESTTDGSIESLLQVTQIASKMGVFDDEMVRMVKSDFMSGIKGSLNFDLKKVPKENQNEFKNIISMIMNLVRKVSNVDELLDTITKIVQIKKAVFKRYHVSESISEDKYQNIFKQIVSTLKNGDTKLWNKNKKSITLLVSDLMISFTMGVLKPIVS